jgi:benzoyl-CoA reductase/2-hydroxyglutaryl-CoA dehydratase subunit BcrC/BadD/HgdB
VVRLAREYSADGVVYYMLQFCHEFNAEFARIQRALRAEGIPVIKIETGYSDSDSRPARPGSRHSSRR